MRFKLVVFLVVLAVAGMTLGRRISRDPRCFIGTSANDSELATVPHRADLHVPPEIRVNLTPAPVSQIEMTVDEPYSVHTLGSRAIPRRREVPGRAIVAVTSNGIRVGRREFQTDVLEIEAERSPAIWIADHLYRGRIQVFRQTATQMIVVNAVALEDYVSSVVDSEMPGTFPPAARQAQAIVARSYVLYQAQAGSNGALFDVYATTRSQNYLGSQYRGRDGRRYAAESPSSRRAAEQTAGMICLCDGKPFCTYYTAVCGGETVSGSSVFGDAAGALRPVRCDGCQEAELYRWSSALPVSEATDVVKRYFVARGQPFRQLTSFRRILKWEKIREPAFEVGDGRRRYRLSVFDLRRLFSTAIHSFQFDARIADGQLVIEGRGHGHGVGLCQWGARGMALEGASTLEIVRHYYPGAEVVVVD